jgi:DNA-binding response OmpR family regulator
MKINITIISDDILFWNLFIPLLNRNIPNVQILVCSTYSEIDKKTEKTNCDLIIVDGGLSNLSSIELIQYIRMKKRILAPIWFFPEILTEAYILKAKEMGVNKFITKPFDPYVVIDEITAKLLK